MTAEHAGTASRLPPAAPGASGAQPPPARERVLELLRDQAWTSRELGEALGVDRKTADHHLHALWRRGIVARRDLHGERRFALAHGAPRAFAQARAGRTRARIARAVERRGLAGLDELAREAGVSHGLAAYHVRRLAAEGIVGVRRQGARTLVQARGLAVQAEEPTVAG